MTGEGSGQDLASPGSCLEMFAAIPFAECNSHNQCKRQASNRGYWLAATDVKHDSSVPSNSDQAAQRIGRCRVCARSD